MGVELLVGIVSAVVALASAALTALVGARDGKQRAALQDQLERQRVASLKQEARQDLMNRFRDPLLWAAFDLQSRIFNIVAGRFVRTYLIDGSFSEREYARNNTMFVLAEYLGWVEILRRRVQFLDLGSREENRNLVNCFSEISDILNTDSFPDSLFRIFRGEQRAIGEIMIDTGAKEVSCIGYAEFCTKLDEGSSFNGWFARLAADMDQLAQSPTLWHPRLVKLQHHLIGLINFLDPESIRFPDRHRQLLDPEFRRP